MQLFVSLQPQLDPDSDIYIVDSSPNREGLRLSKLYGSTRCYIFVEVGKYDWRTAYGFAKQSMLENNQEGLVCLLENTVISNTFISNVRKVIKMRVLFTFPRYYMMPYDNFPSHFSWYNPVVKKLRYVNNRLPFNECFVQVAAPLELKTAVFDEEAVVMLPTPKLSPERTT